MVPHFTYNLAKRDFLVVQRYINGDTRNPIVGWSNDLDPPGPGEKPWGELRDTDIVVHWYTTIKAQKLCILNKREVRDCHITS